MGDLTDDPISRKAFAPSAPYIRPLPRFVPMISTGPFRMDPQSRVNGRDLVLDNAC
jgi:hypothetical protein